VKKVVKKCVDFTVQKWGHALSLRETKDGGHNWRVHGFCKQDLNVGDFVLLKDGYRIVPYIIKEIRFCKDPTDQFFGSIEFVSRKDPRIKDLQ
jgi:hypothetical protein